MSNVTSVLTQAIVAGLPTGPRTSLAALSVTNKINVVDLGNFVGPVRRLNTSLGHPNFGRRWDILPGSTVGEMVNIQDLANLTTFFPPMFGGTVKAFNNPAAVCTES